MEDSRLRWNVWFIVLMAFAVRMAVIVIGHTYKITPRGDHFQFGWEMGRLARSVALGQGFANPTDVQTGPSAWAPPLYPFLLGGIFKLFGIYTKTSALVILTFNSICASLTCWSLYRVGERVFGVSVARGVAWTWAVFPYALYWPTRVVWETSLTTFLLTIAVLWTLELADDGRPLRWMRYGLLWGVILLTNTAVVSMLPFCGLWLFAEAWRSGKSPTLANQIRGALLCGAVAVVVISPWLARNYRTFGTFVFIRDNLPLELHMANNSSSDALWTREEHPANNPEAMKQFRELGEFRFMQQKKAELKEFLREHPGRFVTFSLERAAYFWIAPPQATIVNGYDMMISRHMNFFLGAAFAFAGMIWALRDRIRAGWLLASFLIFYPIPYYMANPFPRYKHPIEPVMCLFIVFLFWKARGIEVRWPWSKTLAT